MMPKILDCDRCQRYSGTPNLVCPTHPTGPDSDYCLDFAPTAGAIAEKLVVPSEAGYYGGELIPQSHRRLTRTEQLELLETHPLFTGRYPQCSYEVNEQNCSRSELHCDRCG